MQPYLLTENISMPFEEQGSASGYLGFIQEIITLPSVFLFGALSDRLGRRKIFVTGMVWWGAAFTMYPFVTSYTEILIVRGMSAFGAAMIGAMLVTVMSDYPSNRSRGKFVGISGVFNALGALVAIGLLSRLPDMFASMGADTLQAGRYTYWVTAFIAFCSAGLLFSGLADRPVLNKQENLPFLKIVKDGLNASKTNPRLILANITAFVARGDMVVIGTFLMLWGKEAGLEQGMTLEEAIKTAGMFAAIAQSMVIVAAPIWGILLDRFDRVLVTAGAMFLAAVGYTWVGFSDSPIVMAFIPGALLLGVGEIGAILTGQALAGQEAPDNKRGAVMGLYAVFGSFGMLTISVLGGLVFDAWMPGAPFVLVGVLQVLVGFLALLVWRQSRVATGP